MKTRVVYPENDFQDDQGVSRPTQIDGSSKNSMIDLNEDRCSESWSRRGRGDGDDRFRGVGLSRYR